MFVRNNLPVAAIWNPEDSVSANLLSRLLSVWPEDVSIPILLFPAVDINSLEKSSVPDFYKTSEFEPSQPVTLHRHKIYICQPNLQLEFSCADSGIWSLSALPESKGPELESTVHIPSNLSDYAAAFSDEGTIFDCSATSPFQDHCVYQTPVLETSRILELDSPCDFLSRQLGKARSLQDVVTGKINALLENVVGVRLDWFHRGWQFAFLNKELGGSFDLLSYCDAFSNSTTLINKLFARNRSHFFLPNQLLALVSNIYERLHESDQQVKVWLIGGGELQLLQLLYALLANSNDPLQLAKRIRIYVTDSINEPATLTGQGPNETDPDELSFPAELIDHYKNLQIESVEKLANLTRTIRQRLVVHSKLNVFSDPVYRNVDVLVCGGLLGGLTSIVRRNLLHKLSAAQISDGFFLTAPSESNHIASVLEDSGFKATEIEGLYRVRGNAGSAKYTNEFSVSQSEQTSQDDVLAVGRIATFVLDDSGKIIDYSGSTQSFTVRPISELNSLETASLFNSLSDNFASAAKDLFHNRHPLKTCKKLIIAETDVIMLSIHKERKRTRLQNDSAWTFTIESVEDIELDLSVDKIGRIGSESAETRVLLTNIIADGQLQRQKSFRKLEDLNLELASKNEFYSNEAAKYRLLNDEVNDSNSSLNKQLRAAYAKISKFESSFLHGQLPAAMIGEHGNFELVNDAMIERLGLSSNRLKLEKLDIFKLEGQLPKRTLLMAFGEALKTDTKQAFATSLFGESVEVILTPIITESGNRTVLLEILTMVAPATDSLEIDQLFKSINVATLITSKDGLIKKIDSTLQSWLGIQELTPIGRNFSELLAPDYHSLHEAKWEELDQYGYADYEVALMSDGNRLVWCRVKIVNNPGDESGSYLLLLENVLEQQRTQQETLMSQKMESLGLLTGGIAHDFNNILAVIMGYADLLLLNGQKTHSPQLGHLKHIRDAGERAQHLIKQMLFYSRGDDHHEARQHDICKAVSAILPLVRSSFPPEIELSTEIEVKNALVDIDPTHLDQILMNMCINARDAVEGNLELNREGEITIAVDHSSPSDEVRQCASCRSSFRDPNSPQAADEYITIRVTDNGIGIEEDVIEHIFDPFFSTKEVGKGSGMGLSVIHGLVHQYGGHIEIFSSNYGAQFCIWLPVSKQKDSGNKEAQKPMTEIELPRWNVLLVEDDAVVAEVTAMMLTNLGLKVVSKEDGLSATHYLQSSNHEVDIIISDLSMPKMDGLSFSHWCYDNDIRSPILLLTGNDSALDSKDLPSNVDSVLSKPATMRDLAERLVKIKKKVKDSETELALI